MVVFSFSFHFCFDLPQVSNCCADWGLITAAGEADGGLITGAGKAYDSGREAHYWGGKGLGQRTGCFLCAFRFFFFL